MIFFKGRISVESLVQYLNGTVDESLINEIEKWIKTSRENYDFFNRLKDIWKNQEDLSSLLVDNRMSDWKKVAIACKDEKPAERPSKKIHVSLWWRRIAAAILLLVFSALGYFAGMIKQSNPARLATSGMHEITVPEGVKSKLKLSDGTILWINAGTTIRFPNSFVGATRDIWLDGEAYFEVSKDKAHPFYVHTSDVDVKVYGTKFNLKAYNDEDIFEATLIEGLVSLETRNMLNKVKEEVFLEPNHKAVYLKKKPKTLATEIIRAISQPIKPRQILISNPIEVEPVISWRDGRLEFYDETLENIAVKLERRYGVVMKMQDEEMKDLRYTGVLKNIISIEQALKAIQMTTDFDYEIRDNLVIIKDSGKNKKK
jgi:ferric-dicitrate binding protein FerR (iron transport regulator)